MGEVGLGHAARLMDLLEDDLLVRTMERTPGGDAALERAELAGLIAAGMLLAQQSKEGLGLQGTVALEVGLDPGPVGGKGIGARAIGARLFELSWAACRRADICGQWARSCQRGQQPGRGFCLCIVRGACGEPRCQFSWAPSCRAPYYRVIQATNGSAANRKI